MKPSIAYQQHRDAIRQIVERHHAKNPRIFGSVLHGQDTDDSDLDILIDTTEETSLFDVGAIRTELTELLGVEVDVLTPDQSRNVDTQKYKGCRQTAARAICNRGRYESARAARGAKKGGLTCLMLASVS